MSISQPDIPLFTPDGLRVQVDDLLCLTFKRVQYRFPRSRKKRIRNKWRKRPENFRIKTGYQAIQFGNTLLVHSKTYDALKKASLAALHKHFSQH